MQPLNPGPGRGRSQDGELPTRHLPSNGAPGRLSAPVEAARRRPYPWRWWIPILGIALVLVASRRPDALLGPQLWAEDGAVWLADAYRGGASALLEPRNGYLQTLSRLGGAVAAALPLRFAPSVMGAAAWLVQLLPLAILASRRAATLGPPWARAALGLLYIGLPYSFETHLNLTTAKWRLLVSAFLLLVIHPPRSAWSRATDVSITALSAMSGPFAVLLAPVATWLAWSTRRRWTALLSGILIMGAAIQIGILLQTGGLQRSPTALGADVRHLIEIVGGQVALGALVGLRGVTAAHAVGAPVAVDLCALLLIALPIGWAAVRGPRPLRAYLMLALLILVAALRSPVAADNMAQWSGLSLPGAGSRYWLHPILAIQAALFWAATAARRTPVRWLARVLLGVALLGIIGDWRLPRYVDFGWAEHVRRLERAAPGTSVTIPINPPGWSVTLEARPRLGR